MGARLSGLQSTILRLAWEGRQLPSKGSEDLVDVYTSEIFAVAYLHEDCSAEERRRRFGAGGQRFSMRAIGEKKYRSAKAAISRAIGRLEQRGLVRVYEGAASRWTGVALTEVAMGVVNTGARLPTC
jgi:hypothetical protein